MIARAQFGVDLTYDSMRAAQLDRAGLIVQGRLTMGWSRTSLEMIERTYGHLVRGADDAFRTRLDAFAADRVGVEWAPSAKGESR
jgi:hypothetical protein